MDSRKIVVLRNNSRIQTERDIQLGRTAYNSNDPVVKVVQMVYQYIYPIIGIYTAGVELVLYLLQLLHTQPEMCLHGSRQSM